MLSQPTLQFLDDLRYICGLFVILSDMFVKCFYSYTVSALFSVFLGKKAPVMMKCSARRKRKTQTAALHCAGLILVFYLVND